ncbi:MAG: cytochrome P450 [Planctomycetaceae bacterium]|nr:cytochrome P450 [Planctomycetaceae bacterium]
MTLRTTAFPLPPGPRGRSLFGQLREFRENPVEFLTRLARDYGDVAQFRLGRRRVVQLNDPELIHEVLVARHRSFHKTGVLTRAKPVLGNGLVTIDGDLHLKRRRLIQPAFNRQSIPHYIAHITTPAADVSGGWRPGQRVELADEMNRLTLRIILRALFDCDAVADDSHIEDALTTVLRHFNRLLIDPKWAALSKLPLPAARQYRNAQQLLDSFVRGLIQQRRAESQSHHDVLSILLQAHEGESGKIRLTDDEVRDEVMTLLTAGHETIATALTWTWHALSQHPEIESQMHQEVDSVLQGRKPTFDDLKNLRYTRMVLAESMRMYPPVWGITRLAMEDLQLGGYAIPKGTVVGMTQYVTHRDPRYFPNPEHFDPTRWARGDEAAGPKSGYFPFGGGPRLCIGEPFAWAEGIVVLATIAQAWRIRSVGTEAVRYEPMITLRPKNGIAAVVERREENFAARNKSRNHLVDAL